MDLNPFHITLAVRDIDEARHFYHEVLGCRESRKDARRIDFNLYGHLIVCHLNPLLGKKGRIVSDFTPLDDEGVPVPHCGVVLEKHEWSALVERLTQHRAEFATDPYVVRCGGARCEPTALLLHDPSGNPLEFRSIYNVAEILRRKQKMRFGAWMPWAILIVFISCWVLLQAKKSMGEGRLGNSAMPTQVPSCSNVGDCVRPSWR